MPDPNGADREPDRRVLAITRAGNVDDRLIQWLASDLESEFAWLACVPARPFGARAIHRAGNGDYPVDLLLDELVEWWTANATPPVAADWLLAVSDDELSARSQASAFGEATVGGCCAVVGVGRLRPPGRADRGEDLALLRSRLLKVAVHEIGHVAGLGHCDVPRCAMVPAADLRSLDARSALPCARCLGRIRDAARRT